MVCGGGGDTSSGGVYSAQSNNRVDCCCEKGSHKLVGVECLKSSTPASNTKIKFAKQDFWRGAIAFRRCVGDTVERLKLLFLE